MSQAGHPMDENRYCPQNDSAEEVLAIKPSICSDTCFSKLILTSSTRDTEAVVVGVYGGSRSKHDAGV